MAILRQLTKALAPTIIALPATSPRGDSPTEPDPPVQASLAVTRLANLALIGFPDDKIWFDYDRMGAKP
jgi:hypothetical protein